MIPLHTILAAAAGLVLSAVGGFAAAVLRDRRARFDDRAARRGRAVTVPMLVTQDGRQSRARGVVRDGALCVVGPRTHLRISREAWLASSVRRGSLDEELLEFSEQRGFVDAAGDRRLVGPVEEWSGALQAQLDDPAAKAGRLRVFLAAVPRSAVGPLVAGVLAFAAFQGIWFTGHDVGATMIRVVGDEGVESCAVRWQEQGRQEHAEVDCYPPFPPAGATVRVRALAWPFDESAMDLEDTYPMASLLLGGATVLAAAAGAVVAGLRLRRPAIRLAAATAPPVTLAPAGPRVVDADAPLPDLVDAVGVREGWEAEPVSDPPSQPWWAPYRLAASSARWWPGLLLAGAAVLVEGLDRPWRVALALGAGVALGWALVRAVITWAAIRPSLTGPVTSEWDYRLVRTVEEEWVVLLLLGVTVHWLVVLAGPGHPSSRGRCGIRGDLRDGGAVHLRFGDAFWPTVSPVTRVDDEVVADIREDLLARLAVGGAPSPSDGRAQT